MYLPSLQRCIDANSLELAAVMLCANVVVVMGSISVEGMGLMICINCCEWEHCGAQYS